MHQHVSLQQNKICVLFVIHRAHFLPCSPLLSLFFLFCLTLSHFLLSCSLFSLLSTFSLQHERARKGFIRAKDYVNIARLKEVEGDYSGAVRVFVKANRRQEALERAARYEQNHQILDPDVSLFQLANEYAKYFAQQRQDELLKSAIKHIPNVVMRVTYLKQASLFSKAVDEYIKAGRHVEANRLMVAQEMYDRAILLSRKVGNRENEAKFLLLKVTSKFYHHHFIDGDLELELSKHTKNEKASIQAHALLLRGVIYNNPGFCRQAMELYQNAASNVVGRLEAFNALLKIKIDVPIEIVVQQCSDAFKLAHSLQSLKLASDTCNLQQALDFYQLTKLEKVYLFQKTQDIWLGELNLAVCCNNELDEDGFFRLDPASVHKHLVSHFDLFWKAWLVETDIENKIKQRLDAFSFHTHIMKRGYLLEHVANTYPAYRLKEYLTFIDLGLQLKKLSGKLFSHAKLEAVPLRLFSPQIAMCLPVGRIHRVMLNRSKPTRDCLSKVITHALQLRSLRNIDVDNLFMTWRACIIADGCINRMVHKLEEYATKEGQHNPTDHSLIAKNERGTDIHSHFFMLWLRACHIIRAQSDVVGAMKLIYLFLSVVSRRHSLCKSMSVANYINVVTVGSVACLCMLALISPDKHVMLPLGYRHIVLVFDELNFHDKSDRSILSACAQQVYGQEHDHRLDKAESDAVGFLFQFLDLLLGRIHKRYNVLGTTLKSLAGQLEDGQAVHCISLALLLVANLIIVSPADLSSIYSRFIDLYAQLGSCIDRVSYPSKLPIYFRSAYHDIGVANSVGVLLNILQQLQVHYKFPAKMCRLQQRGKPGNIDFHEVPIPVELFEHKIEPVSQAAICIGTPKESSLAEEPGTGTGEDSTYYEPEAEYPLHNVQHHDYAHTTQFLSPTVADRETDSAVAFANFPTAFSPMFLLMHHSSPATPEYEDEKILELAMDEEVEKLLEAEACHREETHA